MTQKTDTGRVAPGCNGPCPGGFFLQTEDVPSSPHTHSSVTFPFRNTRIVIAPSLGHLQVPNQVISLESTLLFLTALPCFCFNQLVLIVNVVSAIVMNNIYTLAHMA